MAKKRFSGGAPGGMNMNALMKQAQKMQEDMQKAQADLETKEVEASVGGGTVVVKVNGKNEIVNISIKPEAVDPDDVEMLEDMVMSAVNQALKSMEELKSSQMGKLTGGMNMPGLF